jgi:hypothetical protein
MKNLLYALLLVFVVLCLGHSFTSGQSLFSKKISTTSGEPEMIATLTTDHSALLFASQVTTALYPHSPLGFTIGKMDTSGNLVWKKKYDPVKPKWRMYPKAILPRSYGYLIAGSLVHSKGDATLMKIDEDGNLLSFNSLHPIADHSPTIIPHAMVVRPDGALIMTGTVGLGHEHTNLLWLKTDETFSSYTVKKISSGKDLLGIGIFAEPNNKVYIVFNNGNLDGNLYEQNTVFPSIMKLDADGNVLTTKNYKLPIPAVLNDCIRLDDGSFVLTGTGYAESYIMKISSSLDLLWCKYYPIANNYYFRAKAFNSIASTGDGGLIVSGELYNNGMPQPSHYLVMKTDEFGDAVNYHLSQGTDYQQLGRIYPVSSSTYLATEEIENEDGASTNIFSLGADLSTTCPFVTLPVIGTTETVVTDKNNNLEPADFVNQYLVEQSTFIITDNGTAIDYCSPLRQSDENNSHNQSMAVFPNPASGKVNIELPEYFADGKTQVDVVNLFGQIVLHVNAVNQPWMEIAIDQLPAGHYLLRAISERGNFVTASLEVQ